MEDLIEHSEEIRVKLFEEQFGEVIKVDNALKGFYYWIIDSNYKIKKRLDLFINDQLENPTYRVVNKTFDILGEKPHLYIVNLQNWVYQNIKYKGDELTYYAIEKWVSADQVLRRKADDCDGLNSTINVLARLRGIPKTNLYNVIGYVYDPILKKEVLHYYLLYWSTRYDQLYSIDATYKPNVNYLSQRKPFKLSDSGYSRILYLWNDEVIYKIK